MKITDELREAAEKYANEAALNGASDTRHIRADFIAGAQWAYDRGRREERERILGLLRENKDAISFREYGQSHLHWADWLKSHLAALDARPGETSGEVK